MTEREKVLQLAFILMKHGEPLPIDLLARAEQLGLEVDKLDDPQITPITFEEGDYYE